MKRCEGSRQRMRMVANETAKVSSSLQKLFANGGLRQNSPAIANAMAW